MFYLTPHEVRDALFDYGNGWAVGTEPIGPAYWPAEIAAAQDDHGGARDAGRRSRR